MPRRTPHLDGSKPSDADRDRKQRDRDSGRYTHESLFDPMSAGAHPPKACTDGGQASKRTSCPKCHRQLGPVSGQCPYCKADIEGPAPDEGQIATGANVSWTFDRVIFTVVPAPSESIALAKASGIFRRRDGRVTSIRDHELKSFELVDDFDKAPLKSVAKNWGDVPACTPALDDIGQDILTEIAATEWERVGTDGGQRPPIYDEYGAAITDADGFDSLQEEIRETDGDQYYLVSALALIPSTESKSDAGTRDLHCRGCTTIQPHTYDGPAGVPPALQDYHRNGEAVTDARATPDSPPPEQEIGPHVWMCLQCHTPRLGPKPALDVTQESVDPTDRPAPEVDPEGGAPGLEPDMLPKPARGPEAAHEFHMEHLDETGNLPPAQPAQAEDTPDNTSDGDDD